MSPIKKIISWVKADATPGVLLIIAGILAMYASNSQFAPVYEHLLETNISVHFGATYLEKPFLLWINDGLMAVFFLLVGIEIKREIYEGNLSSLSRVMLPTFAALGGVIFPAIIFYLLNEGNVLAMRGWAIPTATDIAFALGILTLLGSRVPRALKMLLTTIAILDDLLAIAIIAIFYSGYLSYLSLCLSGIAIVLLMLLNHFRVRALSPYLVVGVFLWICVLKSGVHATLAGVVLAFAIPLQVEGEHREKPVHILYHALHPWVFYGILPVFAFANAGVSLQGIGMGELLSSVPLGIALGLFVGKQAGVFLFAWVAVKLNLADKPHTVSWPQIYGMAILCGVGFTMSLFIGSLAYEHGASPYALINRIGILAGSCASALLGYIVLRILLHNHRPPH